MRGSAGEPATSSNTAGSSTTPRSEAGKMSGSSKVATVSNTARVVEMSGSGKMAGVDGISSHDAESSAAEDDGPPRTLTSSSKRRLNKYAEKTRVAPDIDTDDDSWEQSVVDVDSRRRSTTPTADVGAGQNNRNNALERQNTGLSKELPMWKFDVVKHAVIPQFDED
jgi:hypothetical protein